MREEAELKRAKQAQKVCEAEQGPAHEEFVRIRSNLAARAGLTQAKMSSGTVPTLPLLAKFAKALDASFNIALDDDESPA
jgi:ethanolamine ammonia-lyase small subunit